MAWIEAHQTLEKHPKTYRLRKALGWNLNETIGFLMRFWWWSLDAAPDGRVSMLADPGFIEEAFGIRVPEERFVAALIDAGFLDRDGDELRIHDWEDYIGRLVDMRERNRERARTVRARYAHGTKNERAPCAQRSGLHNPTQPNTTKPPLKPPNGGESEYAKIYELYPRKVGRGAAIRAIGKALERIRKRPEPPPDPTAWLAERVTAFAASPAGQAGKFCPHPATWFNADRFDDDPSEWARAETIEPDEAAQAVAAMQQRFAARST